MRFIIGFILVFVFVQSAPVVRQANPTDSLQGLDDDFDDFLAQMADILTPEEFESFQKDLYQLILSAAGDEIDSEEFQLKFEILLEQYLGPYSQSRFDFQNLAEQFVDAAIEVLPSLIENVLDKREATDIRPPQPMLFEQIDTILLDHLPPMQMILLEKEVLLLMVSGIQGDLNRNEIFEQLTEILQLYLGSKPEVLSQVQPLFQQIIEAALLASPGPSKRQANDAIQFDAILAAAPQLSVLINPLKEVLAQLATSLPPAQLQSLQEQVLQLISSAAAGKIDVNQLKDQLEALLQPYLTSNRNFDQLIQQVVSTDTAGLPNVIINFLSKRDVNID